VEISVIGFGFGVEQTDHPNKPKYQKSTELQAAYRTGLTAAGH
jgi:hypothetical protein